MNGAHKIAVIGGGVSGIAAAHYLLEAGYSVDLYEVQERLGGRICIDKLDGREVCFGGKNIGHAYKEFRAFLERYSAPKYEYFGINSARLVRGNIKAFNTRKKFKSLFNILEASTPSDLVKLFLAMKAIKLDRLNGDLNAAYFQGKQIDITRYFSSKLTKTIIRALTVRMNGAEPHNISLENFGTHLQMLQDSYEQLQTPLSDSLEFFAKSPNLSVFTRQNIEAVRPDTNGYNLMIKGVTHHYSHVVFALPANITRQLLAPHFKDLARILERVRYYPVGVIIAKYNDPVFSKEIRALTFDATSPLSNIGAYGVHDLNWVRYTLSGEAAEETLHETLNDNDLINMAEAIASPYFNIAANERVSYKKRYWPSGLCGYTMAEAEFQRQLKSDLSKHSGLYLTGDYIKGASIENCFRASKSETHRLISVLKSQNQKSKHTTIINEADYV